LGKTTRRTLSYASTKTYTHATGLSCCFRQHRAESHCRLLHGYALKVHIEFRASRLDENNWVVDFGSLKEIKKWLEDNFDHKLLVAKDDPELISFNYLHKLGLADVRIVERTGCEAFAAEIMHFVAEWADFKFKNRVAVYSVAINEHEANGAIVYNQDYIDLITKHAIAEKVEYD
jgi:6-pyruvoyltetrahydropterin/6-carboxytetrahydropterin synthase